MCGFMYLQSKNEDSFSEDEHKPKAKSKSQDICIIWSLKKLLYRKLTENNKQNQDTSDFKSNIVSYKVIP